MGLLPPTVIIQKRKFEKEPKNLENRQIIRTFAVEFHKIHLIGRWCNGNTTGFGSVIPGSNPSRPT